MGHNRLGILPKNHRWKHVIDLLKKEADLPEITRASLHAMLTNFERIPKDAGFNLVLSNIFGFAAGARSGNFQEFLEESGIRLSHEAGPLDIVCGLQNKIDNDLGRQRSRSDPGEIAQNAFVETMLSTSSAAQSAMFDLGRDAAINQIGGALKGKEFAGFMHAFFTKFTSRYMKYYLSRELSNHVGPGKYFESIDRHREFNETLGTYISQVVRIADEFTPGWFSKANYEQNLNRESISRYSYIAFKKIISEFKRGETLDG